LLGNDGFFDKFCPLPKINRTATIGRGLRGGFSAFPCPKAVEDKYFRAVLKVHGIDKIPFAVPDKAICFKDPDDSLGRGIELSLVCGAPGGPATECTPFFCYGLSL
jgi:hypothetical protein